MAKKKELDKFEFSVEYQQELIRSMILDSEVRNIFTLIKESYFTLIEHQLIYVALQRYLKKKKKVPSRVILKELILELVSEDKYRDLVLKEDLDNIFEILPKLYEGSMDDTDDIKKRALEFISYIRIRDLNNAFDLTDFHQYSEYSKKFNQVLSLTLPHKKDRPKSFVKDVVTRQFNRQSNPDTVPTPFHQVNSATNGGGYTKGSIIVLLDKAKATKTYNLVNIARSYLVLRKRVLIIDNENGEDEYLTRLDQSTLNKTKQEINSGEFDDVLRSHMRKYARLGVDIRVRRVPAMVTTCNDIEVIMDELKAEDGFVPNVLIVDSAYKLASNDGIKENMERISAVYVELGNLALKKNIDHVWTAHHVKRDAEKNQSTRYIEENIAMCIDITKHAQAIWGLNYTEDEREENIQRWELVVQRDGPPVARALFHMDVPRQRFKEFSKKQRKAYDEQYGKMVDEELKKKPKFEKVEKPEKAKVRDI